MRVSVPEVLEARLPAVQNESNEWKSLANSPSPRIAFSDTPFNP